MTRVGSLVLIGLLAGWALLLRPVGILGGSTGYVVVHGTSMLPNLHNGDLVISRAHHSYAVGDVVAYVVPRGQLGEGHVVIHRVTAVGADGAITLQGDNNSHTDPWHPHSADVQGAQWLRVPKAGGMVLVLRTPLVAAVVGSILAIWVVAGGRTRNQTAPDLDPPVAIEELPAQPAPVAGVAKRKPRSAATRVAAGAEHPARVTGKPATILLADLAEVSVLAHGLAATPQERCFDDETMAGLVGRGARTRDGAGVAGGD